MKHHEVRQLKKNNITFESFKRTSFINIILPSDSQTGQAKLGAPRGQMHG